AAAAGAGRVRAVLVGGGLRLRGVRRRGRTGAGSARLSLGLLGLLDLLHVRLVAGPRLGVLALPLGLLLLVPGQPLVGLRVEAVRVLVGTRVVVGRPPAVDPPV